MPEEAIEPRPKGEGTGDGANVCARPRRVSDRAKKSSAIVVADLEWKSETNKRGGTQKKNRKENGGACNEGGKNLTHNASTWVSRKPTETYGSGAVQEELSIKKEKEREGLRKKG